MTPAPGVHFSSRESHHQRIKQIHVKFQQDQCYTFRWLATEEAMGIWEFP